MLTTAAVSALLGFAFGLRLRLFGLLVAVVVVTASAAGIHLAVDRWSAGSLLAVAVIAALCFQAAAFVSMALATARSRAPEPVADAPPEPATEDAAERAPQR